MSLPPRPSTAEALTPTKLLHCNTARHGFRDERKLSFEKLASMRTAPKSSTIVQHDPRSLRRPARPSSAKNRAIELPNASPTIRRRPVAEEELQANTPPSTKNRSSSQQQQPSPLQHRPTPSPLQQRPPIEQLPSPRRPSVGIPQRENLWLDGSTMGCRPRVDTMPASWKQPRALNAKVSREMKKKLKDEDPAEVRRKRNLLKVSSRKKRHAIERWRPYLAAVEAVSVDLPRCPQDLLANDEFLLECVRINPACLSYAPVTRYKDRAFLLRAVDVSGGRAMKFCPELMQSNFWFVLEATEANGRAVKHASMKLRDTGEIILAAIATDQGDEARALLWASSDLRNDRDFLRLCLLKNPFTYSHIPDKYKGDMEIELQTALALVHNYNSEGHEGIHIGLYPTQSFPFPK